MDFLCGEMYLDAAMLCNHVTGESESDHHWVYCSKFLLAGLCHLLMCLEKLDVRIFQTPEEYQQVLNITNLLVRKTEMVFSSHLACWSALRPTQHTNTTISIYSENVSAFMYLKHLTCRSLFSITSDCFPLHGPAPLP